MSDDYYGCSAGRRLEERNNAPLKQLELLARLANAAERIATALEARASVSASQCPVVFYPGVAGTSAIATNAIHRCRLPMGHEGDCKLYPTMV